MDIPIAMQEVAASAHAGTPRQRKVRTMLGWYGLQRRRSAGISEIRAHLEQLGLETDPDFETVDLDARVAFVLRGQGVGAAPMDTGDEDDAACAYRVEPAAGGGSGQRYRVVVRTYDAFARLRGHIVERRLAEVHSSGQNARRDDRDRYPFAMVVTLAGERSPEDLRTWAEEACVLDPVEDEAPTEPAAPEAPAFDMDEVAQRIADLGASLRASITDEVRAIRLSVERKVDEIQFETVQGLAQQLNNAEAEAFLKEYDEEHQRASGALRDERDAAYRELTRLQELLDDLAAEYDRYEAGDAYPTMVAVVRLFAELCAGVPIVVDPRAVKSAERSACTRRRQVLQFLLELRSLAAETFDRGGVGRLLRDWFRDRGYDYAQGDSETTAAKHGDDRKFLLDGKPCQLREHVTLFANTPDCVTVYWFTDNDARRLVVGYVGPHLPTVSR